MPNQTFPFPLRTANQVFPFNPFGGKSGVGDPGDSAAFIQPPGQVFYRPWLSVPNGPSFIWPIGLEGFHLEINPSLGIHRYIGGNAVVVNVTHKGEEGITLSGNFPGLTSAKQLQQLRDVVMVDTPPAGKILYLPGVLPYAQRVVVGSASFDRGVDERGSDLTYSISFERIGIQAKYPTPKLTRPTTQPHSPGKGGSARVFKVTSSVNTLRKIAQLKLKSASKWESVYNKNTKLFSKLKITKHEAPNKRLPIGTKIYY